MAISFSFITALAPKIEYRFWWILAVGWIALAVCIILNILSYLKAKRNCRTNIQNIDNYLWAVSYTHLRAHETLRHLVCRLLQSGILPVSYTHLTLPTKRIV